MPHFIAECTDNIREQADLPGLFPKVNEALAATGIFPIGGIRSRAHWLDTWRMADGKQDYAFVHMTLKIGSGRSLESALSSLQTATDGLKTATKFSATKASVAGDAGFTASSGAGAAARRTAVMGV